MNSLFNAQSKSQTSYFEDGEQDALDSSPTKAIKNASENQTPVIFLFLCSPAAFLKIIQSYNIIIRSQIPPLVTEAFEKNVYIKIQTWTAK